MWMAYGRQKVGLTISTYAKTNVREFFAESVSAYTHKGFKKGMLPKEVENFLKQLLGR
jgi:hypothetical protein